MNMKESSIGLIGLGRMGNGLAVNLARAGFSIIGYDLRPEAASNLVAAGGRSAKSSDEILNGCDVVLTCVEGSDSIKLADKILLPKARPDQIFIDHSTVPVHEARRIGKAFIEAGAKYLDAPISGGKDGAEAGTLRVFAGGDKATFDQCLPLFDAIGNMEKVVHCGPIGMGQATKVVQQLTVRFTNVARLEVIAFGLRAGLDLDIVMRGLDITLDSEDPYASLCKAIKSGAVKKFSYEYAEWKYYLSAAEAMGFSMPMLKGMFEFCKDGEKTVRDPLDRAEPSIWNELMKS